MTDHDINNHDPDTEKHESGVSGDQGHPGHEDQPDLHGMLVVGEEDVFLSHLPMFDHPHHAYQVLLKVTFEQPGDDPHATYVNDRKAHRETRIYTLRPENFVLPDLGSSDPGHPHLQSFKGTVFRGHFEKGGIPILKDVEVNVAEVIHFRRFEPLAYLLFGNQREFFLAHLITKPPDFDQVLSAKVVGHEFTEDELRHGVRVTFPGRVNAIHQRLRPNEELVGKIQLAGEEASGTREIKVETGEEFYFEEGELRSPADFRQTKEEQSAGF